MIRSAVPKDAKAICAIYNYYIKNTTISFEEQPVGISEMEDRIRETASQYPWLVCEKDGDIQGYAYLSKYKARSAYRYSAEISIYIKNGEEGKGLGTLLMARLIEEARKAGIHSIISGITMPNERSEALHEKFGFKKTAHFNEVGFKFNCWLDVDYWELILRNKPAPAEQ